MKHKPEKVEALITWEHDWLVTVKFDCGDVIDVKASSVQAGIRLAKRKHDKDVAQEWSTT